jgi:hypothetical protein
LRKNQVSPKEPLRQFRLHINGPGFPGNPDGDAPVAQKMRAMVFLPDGVQDMIVL